VTTPTYDNSGHNSLSCIVTDAGAVAIDAGTVAVLTEALHREIE